jgi:Type II CAAX prenyl endopeptidase Rce1-like
MEKLDRRDVRFVLFCLAAIAVCVAVSGALFRRAFPEASIEFKVNRNQARVLAEKFLEGRGRDLKGTKFAGQFDVDEAPKVYLERELGLERASPLYGTVARIWQWRMRWFRSGVKEEERATYSPLGDLIGYESVLKEDAPGARLDEGPARAIALAFLSERGHPEASLVAIEASPKSRPNRTDWTFVDEKAGVKLVDATIRYETTVAGDRVTAFEESVHVPEAWTRDYHRLRSKNEAAGQIATAGLVLTVLAMLFVLIEKIRRKDVPWRLVAAFGVIAFVLALLSFANDLPLTLFSYDTASPLSAYLTNQVILGILGALGTGAGIAFVAAAEPIYRERFPSQISLGDAFSFRGLQTKAFFRSVLLGYALAAFFFAYQAIFYVVAAHFGAWAPADVPYSDMLNTALPWATVLLIGFLPAVSEEGISRMFSISFLDRLGLSRWIAVALPAFIWGFGHSTYPNQPFYIRGLEVGMAGVLIGFLMLRFGVVPLLVWHFTVDAIYTALLLLRSQNAYYVISGAIASGILLLPLLISLVLYARRGGFLSASGLSNADAGSVPAPPEEAVPLTEVPDVRPLPPGVLAVMGVTALLLFASLFIPAEASEALVEDATGRVVAEATARRFLQVNGVDSARWRSVSYTGTGFADDEDVREARPQDRGGIPGFSSAAARYVVQKGGPEAFRRLAEGRLPLAWWVVRFFRPEQKEEWKVLIDARRARVAAFVNPVAEDASAAPPPSSESASRRALDAARKLGYPADEYSVLEVGTEQRPKRVDTTVVLEAKAGVGQARPRLTAVFHGPRLAFFLPTIHVPESFLREYRKTSSADSFRLVIRIIAGGALLAVAVIVFVRLVRARGIRFKEESKPLLWTAAIAAAGIANGIPAIFRRYPTDTPLILFRLTVAVSLCLSFLFLLLMAFVGFSLISAARPGWTVALRRKGTLGDAFLRAAIAAAGAAGVARWARVIFSRVPSLYEPDPSLPSSLEARFPSIDVLWSTGRGIFFLAALAAVAALALRSRFFQTTLGRLLGAAAVLVALLPSGFHSFTEFVTDALPTVFGAVWLAAAAALLLRDHAAAWVLFGLFSLGLRDATDLAAQPATADRASGGVAVLLLAGAAVALLAGRRDRRVPQPVPIEPSYPVTLDSAPNPLESSLPPSGGEGGAPPTTPSSGSA